jgi:hypothetical protein
MCGTYSCVGNDSCCHDHENNDAQTNHHKEDAQTNDCAQGYNNAQTENNA